MGTDVICVGAVDHKCQKLFFSGRNTKNSLDLANQMKPAFVMPGKNILTATTKLSGTSGAAAITAGIVAILLQAFPNSTSKDLLHLLQENSLELDLSTNTQGSGLPQILPILQVKGNLNPKPRSYYELMKFALKISGTFMLLAVAFIFILSFIK